MQRLFPYAEQNLTALTVVSRYLNFSAAAIELDEVRSLTEACAIPEHEAVYLLLCAYMGLDVSDSPEDHALAEQYIRPGVKPVSAQVYAQNPYYRTICMPEAVHGRWKLTNLTYKPYELFVRDELLYDSEGREIPQTGYFTEAFSYPAVLENNREWMTVTPEETATQQQAVDEAHGKACTLGLGLGYFAFMISEKPEVSSVTVIERDPDVIRLFKEYILPQFPHKEKIRIIEADALVYMRESAPTEQFDTVFADIWHDVADGTELYLRLKRLEKYSTGTKFSYWIERSMLAWLRGMIIDAFAEEQGGCFAGILPEPRCAEDLDDDHIRSAAERIPLCITDGFRITE